MLKRNIAVPVTIVTNTTTATIVTTVPSIITTLPTVITISNISSVTPDTTA